MRRLPDREQYNITATSLYNGETLWYSLMLLKLAVASKYAKYVSFRNLSHTEYGAYTSLKQSAECTFSVLWQDKAAKPMAGKVLVCQSNNPISTFDHDCENKLSELLDGYDGINGDMGMPRLLILPFVFGQNHKVCYSATLMIEPLEDGGYAVSYFNQFGSNSNYKADDDKIAAFVRNRYGAEMRRSKALRVEDRDTVPINLEVAEIAVDKVMEGKFVYYELDNISDEAASRKNMREAHWQLLLKYPTYLGVSRNNNDVFEDFSPKLVKSQNLGLIASTPDIRLYDPQEDLRIPLLAKNRARTRIVFATAPVGSGQHGQDETKNQDVPPPESGPNIDQSLLTRGGVNGAGVLLGTTVVALAHYHDLQLYISMPVLAALGFTTAIFREKFVAMNESESAYIIATLHAGSFAPLALLPMAQRGMAKLIYGTALEIALEYQVMISAAMALVLIPVSQVAIAALEEWITRDTLECQYL